MLLFDMLASPQSGSVHSSLVFWVVSDPASVQCGKAKVLICALPGRLLYECHSAVSIWLWGLNSSYVILGMVPANFSNAPPLLYWMQACPALCHIVVVRLAVAALVCSKKCCKECNVCKSPVKRAGVGPEDCLHGSGCRGFQALQTSLALLCCNVASGMDWVQALENSGVWCCGQC
jgi:hypothetical protein